MIFHHHGDWRVVVVAPCWRWRSAPMRWARARAIAQLNRARGLRAYIVERT